ILKRSNDRATIRIVLRVSRKDEEYIQGHPQLEPTDLDIAFLEDIEQGYLYPRLEIGDLVDDEDAAVAFGDDAKVDHLLIGEVEPQVGGLNGVDVPDEVGHAHIGCRQLLAIAFAAMQPANGGVIAFLGDQRPCKFRDGP